MTHPISRAYRAGLITLLLATAFVPSAIASDQIYFPAVTDVRAILIQKINAETVRIDMSTWYLSEHAISIALLNRFKAGVPVREVKLRREDLSKIDELFLTGTTSEVLPIARVDGKPIRDGVPGPVTRKLQREFSDAVKQFLG